MTIPPASPPSSTATSSTCEAQQVTLEALDLTVGFEAGEDIRTEISAKFTRERFAAELTAAGLTLAAWHTDENGWFALSLARRAG